MSDQFRKGAASGPSSPEALDTLLTITTSRGWAALTVIGLCLATALAWSVWGTIPTTLSGRGILFHAQDLVPIKASGSGMLKNLYVHETDTIRAGQLVARITHPDLNAEFAVAQKKLKDLQSAHAAREEAGKLNLARRTRAVLLQKKDADFAVTSAQDRIQRLKDRLKEQQELLKIGLITRQDIQSTQDQLDNEREIILKNSATLKQLDAELGQTADDLTRELNDLKQQIETARGEMEVKQVTLTTETGVRSPYSGQIIGVSAVEGSRIAAGDILATLSPGRRSSSILDVVLYFPAMQAKRIRQGMEIQIAPGTVKADKYGYVLGLVTHVGEYPATPQEMNRVLENEELVSELQRSGAMLEVRTTLVPNPETPSGFAWTSSAGPPLTLQAGTACTARAVLEENPPITLVMPMLRRVFLGVGE